MVRSTEAGSTKEMSVIEPTAHPSVGKHDLHSHIRIAYFWTIVGNIARYASGFVISVVLARLLTPSDYGIMGMVLVFTEMLGYLDWTLAKAVVHFRETDPARERSTYFSISIAFGAAFTLILLVFSPLVASFYNEPRLMLLVRVMSFTLLINSIKTVSSSVMARDLRFREVSFGDVSAAIGAGILAIVLAYFGWGVWALVANIYGFSILQLLFYGYKVPPQFKKPDPELSRRVWKYCLPLFGSSVLGKFYENADYLVVGRFLGASSLGFYTVAYRFAMLINERISAVINRVAFPSFAALRDDHTKLLEHWFAVTQRVTLICFPALVWLSMNAEDFVRSVLGEQWLPAALPLQLLCVMTAVKVTTNVVGQILAAVGRNDLVFRYDLITAIVLPVSFVIGCLKGGLLGMGLAWCTVFPLLRIGFMFEAKKALRFSMPDYLRTLLAPLWVSAVCAVAMAPAAWFFDIGWTRLAIRSLLCLGGGAVSIMVSGELRTIFRNTLANPFARLPIA
jgi:O-antigen/teichoic acid export membrane protein